jgi:hypothetical protein
MKGAGGTGGAGGYDGASGDNGSGPPAQKKADAGGAGGGGVVGLGAETLTLDIGGGTGPTLNVLQGLGPDSGGAGVVFFLGTPIDLLGNPVDPSADPNLLGNISLMSAGDPNEQFI